MKLSPPSPFLPTQEEENTSLNQEFYSLPWTWSSQHASCFYPAHHPPLSTVVWCCCSATCPVPLGFQQQIFLEMRCCRQRQERKLLKLLPANVSLCLLCMFRGTDFSHVVDVLLVTQQHHLLGVHNFHCLQHDWSCEEGGPVSNGVENQKKMVRGKRNYLGNSLM